MIAARCRAWREYHQMRAKRIVVDDGWSDGVLRGVVVLVAMWLIGSACGGSAATESSADTSSTTDTTSFPPHTTASSSTESTASVEHSVLTTPAAGLPVPTTVGSELQPNELGQIPILMYHQIGPEPEQFTRTPEQLRADLAWLYEHDFYVISMQDYLTGQIDIPAGKRPVILTFDDSPVSQFRLIPLADGQLAIDPNCAVGILEQFFAAHPDFGRGGHFGLNTKRIFAWAPNADASDQEPYVQMKLRWLLDNGYELGNHTVDHANLAELTLDEVKQQLAVANDTVLALVPDAQMSVITLPYGMYPPDEGERFLQGFTYQERDYAWDGALLVGANPANAPFSTEFDPYETARIQAFDAELEYWYQLFVDAPGLLYVSDGDPNVVTVPEALHPSLAGTLDLTRVGTRELVRY